MKNSIPIATCILG